MPYSIARAVSPFHAVCTRQPETIQASGSASRNSSSAMAALTGLRRAGARKELASIVMPSLRGANGSRERAPDDRLRDEAIQLFCLSGMDCFASLAMTGSLRWSVNDDRGGHGAKRAFAYPPIGPQRTAVKNRARRK